MKRSLSQDDVKTAILDATDAFLTHYGYKKRPQRIDRKNSKELDELKAAKKAAAQNAAK